MFDSAEFELIKSVTKKKKNQGEMSVYYELYTDYGWTPTQLNVMRYCAEECKRQHSGEMSVYWMITAWEYASKIIRYMPNHLDTGLIQVMGKLVEPNLNSKGFRKIPIGVSDGFEWIEKAPWERVPFLLEHLLNSYYEGYLACLDCDAYIDMHRQGFEHFNNSLSESAEDQFYLEYENIHPFRDGNGRTGKIIYNYLLGTLDNPVMPPNFWGGSNP